MKKDKKGKKGMEIEMIGYIILGAITLFVVVTIYLLLKSKGINAIDFLKDMFRLRR